MRVVAEPIALHRVEDSPPVDRLGRRLGDLRISVLDRCNFRCPYCMPEEDYPRDRGFLDAAQRLSPAEIESVARAFVALGVDKLRLTGGEPLLRRDLAQIVERLARIEGVRDLALTTNGSLLESQAATLRAAGLRRITISLDTLDPQRFARLSGGRGDLDAVLRGIAAAERAGLAPLKINAVILRGDNEADVLPLVERFRASGHVLRFIEYMDVGTCNRWDHSRVVGSAELVARISARWPMHALDRAYRGEVAARWAFDDGAGELGFVSSVSSPFCGDCHRARLSADGKLFTCLFATRGADLRGPLRAGEAGIALQARIAKLWRARVDRYSEQRAALASAEAPGRIEMFQIGG